MKTLVMALLLERLDENPCDGFTVRLDENPCDGFTVREAGGKPL